MPPFRPSPAKLAARVAAGREENLGNLAAFCLHVWIRSKDPATQDLATDLEQLLLKRADLYGFPLHTACVGDDGLLALRVTVVPCAFSMELTAAARLDPNWAFPAIWQISELFGEPTDNLPEKVREAATAAFEELVLAWKGQRA